MLDVELILLSFLRDGWDLVNYYDLMLFVLLGSHMADLVKHELVFVVSVDDEDLCFLWVVLLGV